MIKVSIQGAAVQGCAVSLIGSVPFELIVIGHAVKNNPAMSFFESISGKKGKNLVCAAVSALSINLLKSLILLAEADVQYKQGSGFLSLRLELSGLNSEKIRTAEILLSSYLIGIRDAAENYPALIELENIKF